MTKEIELTKDKVALVDDDIFDYLNQWKWYYGSGYASRRVRNSPDDTHIIRMHHMIAQSSDGMEIDHINRDKLDNRRVNLRVCTRSQNMANTDTRNTNTSGYKGVSWSRQSKKWHAQIEVNRKNKHLGYFDNVMDAAQAYKKAAIDYFGEFARIE